MKTIFTTTLEKIFRPSAYCFLEDNLLVMELNSITIIKAYLNDSNTVDEYDAVVIEIINKKRGLIATEQFRFIDVVGKLETKNINFKDGVAPIIISHYKTTADWYVTPPNDKWFDVFNKKVNKYINMFTF